MNESKETTSFGGLLEWVKDSGNIKSEDLVGFTLPLLDTVKRLHENKKVAHITSSQQLVFDDGFLDLTTHGVEFKTSGHLFKKPVNYNAIDLTEEFHEKTNLDNHSIEQQNKLLHFEEEPPTQPAYLLNYKPWDAEFGHYDPLTDIHVIGLYIASLAFGLDFNEKEDLKRFVDYRNSLYFLNKNLHPTLLSVIYEMTSLYREDRTRNLEEVIVKFKNYREYNPEHYVDLTKTEGFRNQDLSDRSDWILSKLKNRLFDVSRRNKLLYFSDKKSFLNLTVSSVPLLLDANNISEKQLIFWNDNIRQKLINNQKLPLNQFLDFKQNRFLAPTLDKIRLTARKSENEYGFSPMRLVVAFLHWYNFKEDGDEKITSPLLLLPASITKKKGVNDTFQLCTNTTEAEINPVLSYFLKDLYNINLPEFIELNSTAVEDLIKSIEQQIAAGGTGITLNWRKKPQIQLIHRVASKNFDLQSKQLLNRTRGLSLRSFNYSYTNDDYRPLGLQIFEERIRSKNNALEYIINEDLTPDVSNAVVEKARTFYSTNEDGHTNPTIWEIDTCNLTVGNFNYRKMSLVRDYNEIITVGIRDEIFENLFSELPKKTTAPNAGSHKLEDNYPIISSDPTQSSAIELARSGESYIIQGPPGTGKSQTITNLIADYVARDKKVLFVCEKRAALDVVFHRLKNKHLDELCCLVHDSQGDKKSFIMDLKTTYEDFLKNDFDLNHIRGKRKEIIGQIQAEIDQLKYFHETMRNGDIAPFELFEVLHANKGKNPFPSQLEIIEYPGYKEWKENRSWVTEWLNSLKSAGIAHIADYPFAGLSQVLLQEDNLKAAILKHTAEAVQIVDEFSELIDDLRVTVSGNTSLGDWKSQFKLAHQVYSIFEAKKLKVFDSSSDEARNLKESLVAINALQMEHDEIRQKNKNWFSKFTEQDAESALTLWNKYNSNFLKFLFPGYHKLLKQVKYAYAFSAHQVKPDIGKLLENLLEEYALERKIAQVKKETNANFGFGDFEKDTAWVKEMQQQPKAHLSEWINEDYNELIEMLHGFHPKFEKLYNSAELLFGNVATLNIVAVETKLSGAEKLLSSLSASIPYIKNTYSLSPQLKQCLTQKRWSLSEFEFNLAYTSLSDIYEKEVQFAEMNEDGLSVSVRRINSLLDQYYEANMLEVRAKSRHKFLNMVRITESVAAQLTQEEKNLKKEYLAARRILENEFGKSMRYKSIRDLASGEANSIMTALKPVWLMSPLSVSDTMPIDISLFDVVIFDEASQITVEEGVPSLFRTKQTIIVGDEMQMPPTNFFNSINLQDDEDEEIEQQIGISLDADSLLNQGVRKLSSVMLGWHYRSKRESLISFSNAAFYSRNLLTIPDNALHNPKISAIEPILDVDAAIEIESILERSISFHYLEAAIYENRKNTDEANYIANIVRELLMSKTKKSIGIVAFSMDQQSEIENALGCLALADPAFDSLLEKEFNRVEEDQFNGLFVKNLENVQGDERDIIIMSVCYGHNEKGKMLMNFGPINRRGGEKRLNVIFSRAKEHMVVVSSILPHEIKNDYNEGANYFKKFLTYAQCISDGRLADANLILDGLHIQEDQKLKSNDRPIVDQLKKRLIANGYEVETNIGQSHFKCDLGIKSSIDNSFKLGILLDNTTHYSTDGILEQYCQRPEILKAFGWKVLSVFTKDWLENPDRVLERVEQVITGTEAETDPAPQAISKGGTSSDEDDTTHMLNQSDEAKPEETTQKEKPKFAPTDENLQFERFEFTSDTSNKFWEIAVADNSVIVRYGRIGNKPQEKTKTFTTDDKARKEMEIMKGKKLAKGYLQRNVH